MSNIQWSHRIKNDIESHLKRFPEAIELSVDEIMREVGIRADMRDLAVPIWGKISHHRRSADGEIRI